MTSNHLFEGPDVPPDAVDWIRANPYEAKQVLEGIERAGDSDTPEHHPTPVLEWANSGDTAFPKPILGCAKMGGAILSEGEVCVLSAAGGAGKSTLAASIALSVAVIEDNLPEPIELEGEIFHGYGGPVVYATYEDPPSVIKWRLRELAKQWDQKRCQQQFTSALGRVGVVSMRGWPLYGPLGDRASYNTVPGRLTGWHHLWNLVKEAKPILIIIDPALTAFVGEANSPTQAMSFLDSLSSEAGRKAAGVLLLAHSNKSSRSEMADPFHPGMVSGTGAWTDHVRGVLTMGEHTPKSPGAGRANRGTHGDEVETFPVLRVYKANWGAQRITIRLKPQLAQNGQTPVGFAAGSDWGYGAEPKMAQPQQQSPRGQEDFNDFA